MEELEQRMFYGGSPIENFIQRKQDREYYIGVLGYGMFDRDMRSKNVRWRKQDRESWMEGGGWRILDGVSSLENVA